MGIRGKVVIQVFVGKNGRVRNMRVVQSIVGLDQAALEAVRLWIFKPARFRGTVIAPWVQTAGEFSLRRIGDIVLERVP